MSEQSQRDDSGRDRLFSNVLAGWWAHGVTVVVGFLMPRIIYESVGQLALGLWDIGWSLLVYIAHSGMGTASAVTHYVARFRAEGLQAEVRQTTAAGWYCQLVLAVAAAGALMALFSTLHLWLPALNGFPQSDLFVMGLLLGLAVVVVLLGSMAAGVLTGCHRSSWNEYLTTASDVTLALAMVGVLLAGWGVVGLAAATLATRLVFETGRLVVAARACEEFSLWPRHATWQRSREILRFGTKTSTGVLQELLVHQGARLALAVSAGPVAVALYSRYATLMRQIGRLVDRVTQVITPMTSGLVGLGREEDVRELNLRASNAAIMVVLPMVVMFGVLGDDLVALWMGPQFVVPGLSWVLAVMAAVQGDRGIATQVLSGLNAHGKILLVCLFCSLTVLIMLLVALYPLQPLSAGILVAVSTILGVSVPHFILTCRRLGITYFEHFLEVHFKPLICNALFLVSLLWAREALRDGDYVTAGLWAIVGGSVLVLLYWFVAFDERLRDKVRKHLRPA